MKTSDYDYYLPEELIAQAPLQNRSESRLMVLNRKNQTIEHKIFSDIVDLFDENDVLVFNDTKVIPARIIGIKEETKAVIELLLLKDLGNNLWETLAKPQRRIKIGTIISFGNGELKAKCITKEDRGICRFELIYEGILVEILDRLGSMPLPPYIHKKLEDPNRYQTVYAKHPGSAAAPTAGLHFTNEILEKLKGKGVELIFITLHVGLATFRPVEEDDLTNHVMHEEYYEISKEAAKALNKAKALHKRIIAVGTTSTRTLESAYEDGFKESCASTKIFIYPGYKFKAIDAQITNFHLPKSTLIMLVSALAGREFILKAYEEAVKEKYRFFSFGDAMLIE
ncbi:MAG: tRNA preQ1(34) S-adenosylmethionine ribosyltransferase-isomerase QueA [Roseburia sp.]|nr:tRNA preQ1(34) S-adenosylmethionine ribosyltransferase-isomerase QueA [Anaeroplasma bactoclasticum]MCM1196639.1 tRNA preQ1(34) S-adenosylmethionine ribosyltransferase-isomerase QueA [Roseburia sp.]MCM1557396.1 tRNA preQ1(34) S-adenosylmethionine ribosyltransferase-isomerase QueA [Anaeroplasma bactoclasticum]